MAAAEAAALEAAMLAADDEVIEVSRRRSTGNESSEAQLLLQRQEAAAVTDSISAEEMSRSPGSSAAAAVKRVVAATVVGSRYLFIRGLGDRYVSTLLNGAPLPSPEPDRQAVPLDLFPTQLLSNLGVIKSYDASLPARFGGGTLSINTASFPDDFLLQISASTSSNSASSPVGQNGYGGGTLDFFGYDDGARSLPDAVPRDRPVVIGEGMDAARAERIGESFANEWATGKSRVSPDLGLGFTVGDTTSVSGNQLGYLGSLTFKRKYRQRDALVAKVRNQDGQLGYRERMDSVMGQQTSSLGALLNLGLTPSEGHDIGLFGLYTHLGTDTTTTVTGFNETDGQDIESTRLRFVEQSMGFTQLRGAHELGGGIELRWQGNLARTARDEPDTRDTTFNVVAGDALRFKSEPGSGERFFAGLSELSSGAGASIVARSSMVELEVGAAVQHRARQFDARRFRFVYVGSDPDVLFLPPDQIFDSMQVGTDFELSERTLATDRYAASLLVSAGYASSTMHLSDELRLIAGVRFESSRQRLRSLSPFAPGDAAEERARLQDHDLLRSANAVYALTPRQNLRLAYGSTIARPQFRELAPFLFFDTTRRRSISGNPELVNTRIHNFDARWEWFPGPTEVIAAGVFGKYFNDPIEQVIVSASGGDVSFANAANATALGVELEGRIDLGRFGSALRGLRLASNVSLIRSRVHLTSMQQLSQTSQERPLQGQSPFVVNVGLGYTRGRGETNLFYNVYGRRIAEVGFDSLPDVYEQPRHQLDLSYSHRLSPTLQLKATASNLLAQRLTLEQGSLDIYSYQPGVSIGAGLSWTP